MAATIICAAVATSTAVRSPDACFVLCDLRFLVDHPVVAMRASVRLTDNRFRASRWNRLGVAATFKFHGSHPLYRQAPNDRLPHCWAFMTVIQTPWTSGFLRGTSLPTTVPDSSTKNHS